MGRDWALPTIDGPYYLRKDLITYLGKYFIDSEGLFGSCRGTDSAGLHVVCCRLLSGTPLVLNNEKADSRAPDLWTTVLYTVIRSERADRKNLAHKTGVIRKGVVQLPSSDDPGVTDVSNPYAVDRA